MKVKTYITEIFYYTFEDVTGLDKINKSKSSYRSLKEYAKKIKLNIGLGRIKIKEILGNNKSNHFLLYLDSEDSQWNLPTEEVYNELIEHFNIDKLSYFKPYKELKQEYDNYRKEYEEQRQEYEEQRYTHNLYKEHNNIWYLNNEEIIKRIINTSLRKDKEFIIINNKEELQEVIKKDKTYNLIIILNFYYKKDIFKELQEKIENNGSLYFFNNNFNDYSEKHKYIIEETKLKFNSKITIIKE